MGQASRHARWQFNISIERIRRSPNQQHEILGNRVESSNISPGARSPNRRTKAFRADRFCCFCFDSNVRKLGPARFLISLMSAFEQKGRRGSLGCSAVKIYDGSRDLEPRRGEIYDWTGRGFVLSPRADYRCSIAGSANRAESLSTFFRFASAK
jgi:hypothetical protein